MASEEADGGSAQSAFVTLMIASGQSLKASHTERQTKAQVKQQEREAMYRSALFDDWQPPRRTPCPECGYPTLDRIVEGRDEGDEEESDDEDMTCSRCGCECTATGRVLEHGETWVDPAVLEDPDKGREEDRTW